MPKQYLNIQEFHGGKNSKDAPRDIQRNQLVNATNIMVDKIGRIRSMGAATAHAMGDLSSSLGTLTGGYGIHAFRTDQTGEENLVAVGHLKSGAGLEQNVHIFEEDGTLVDNFIIGGTGTFQPTFYSMEGAVRITDGGFVGKATWWGRIDRNHFGDKDTYDAWYNKTNDLAKPTAGIFAPGIEGTTTNGTNSTTATLEANVAGAFPAATDTEFDRGVYIGWDETDSNKATVNSRESTTTLSTNVKATSWDGGNTYYIFPPDGAGFTADVVATGSDGTWDADDYELGSTFVYENQQESLVFTMGGSLTLTSGDYPLIQVFANSAYDPRIVGGRIYIRPSNTLEAWQLLVDIDLNDGARIGFDGQYQAWTQVDATNGLYWTADTLFTKSPLVDTYETINGYSSEEKAIAMGTSGTGYKTATVANRRAFIANVKTKNADGQTVVMGDRIMYSPVNKFDTFPTSFYLDLGINDGDAFTALVAYADRLYAFKEHILYVINIASGSDTQWFLERVEPHRGVKFQGAVTETEYGITWGNYHGAFLDNGEQTVNLSEQFSDTSRPLGV